MMKAKKQKSQASTSAPAPPANNSPKPPPSASQPTTAKHQTQPRPTPQPSPPKTKTSQNTSLLGTLKELQDPQVVELLTTMREIVRISKTDPTQGEKAIELCELLGINF
ncbi:hypothetical protein TNIN_142381 [Trichonephila inaurata madagascariensis]|uniref:Uncharacterized protein n=1 Tax=Trichonephila inaurata madagascariensis TaxID=2747483 RepID=A0A8X6WXC4_9ARAC|nr:hypothetical protein TNIN_142381 [Trichonephila inaurata madagascariensis]